MGIDADWSVELGADDPVLEFPWATADGQLAYIDLKRYPDRIHEIAETRDRPELAHFLRQVNSGLSLLLTAKCDVWTSDDLSEAEEIYETKVKYCSYVDLLFADEVQRRAFARHEALVKSLAQVVSSSEAAIDSLWAVAAEFVVRRCWFRAEAEAPMDADGAKTELEAGFYVTFYLSGFGADEAEARARWSRGLIRVASVLAQIST